jgi:hypothetical protein
MQTFYGDTSSEGDKRGPYVLTVAGWLATEAEWDAFHDDWELALREAGSSEFHATDFFPCRGPFAGWNAASKRHRQFARRFSAIAESHASYGIGYGMRVSEKYQALVAPRLQRIPNLHGKMTPLMHLVVSVLARLSRLALSDGERVAVVFEREPGMGEVAEFFNWMKRRSKDPWTDRYVSFTTAGKELLPLQAADLLAHECWRAVREAHLPTGRPARKTMQRLTRSDRVTLATTLEEKYEEMAASFSEALQKEGY